MRQQTNGTVGTRAYMSDPSAHVAHGLDPELCERVTRAILEAVEAEMRAYVSGRAIYCGECGREWDRCQLAGECGR